ncbi:Ldh family oxidoreductase [Oleispirillum naphthae]|uniref:Ldh family oxidoreductase n=1 Tax=Oleispirillum naphthae TaxID=2838853 RepID=UPI003082292A
MPDTLHIASGDLLRLVRTAFERVGVPASDAATAAEILVSADLQGIGTHGVRRLGPYVARLRDGVFAPAPTIRIDRTAPATALVDGGGGLGPVVGVRGLSTALEIAAETGIAYVGCRNSQHFGALAPYARRAAEAGMICLLGSTAFATMAPWGGREVRIGNNPIGLGAPRRGAPPFILDIALSVAARGKMRLAQQRGEAIPPGWALDAEGRPTTDPLEGLKGFVLPIGGHKGYGLALAVDILAGVLTGGAVSPEVRSLFQQAREPQGVCHFFIALDPARLLGRDAYGDRIETLCRLMAETPPFDPAAPVLIPGEVEARTLADRTARGIPLEAAEFAAIEAMARGEPPDKVAAF